MTLENKMNKVLKDENIREAAYFIWEKAGRPEGDGYAFWMQAIEQLSADNCCCGEGKKSCSKKATSEKAAPAAKPAVKKVAIKKLAVKK